MRAVPLLVSAIIVVPSEALPVQHVLFEASAAAINQVIAGKTCVGDDVLIFGEHAPGTSGEYERVGRAPGLYQVGYGTLLIKRNKDLHSHVATVSVEDHILYMSASRYVCAP
jgi:hypothetical protein